MSFRPRPYQKAAVEAVYRRYQNQHRKLLLHLPTGAGKTVIATLIIDRLLMANADFGRILFIAHRQEILDQTARTLRKQLRHLSIDIEQGERTASAGATVTLASIQSLAARKDKFDPQGFSLIICDECHRALSPSWTAVIEHFHQNGNPDTLLLGMTATPQRTDGRSAVTVFEEVAFEISRSDLQDLGCLVQMQYYTVQTHLGLDQLKMSAGDYQVKALSLVMNHPQIRQLALRAWQEQGAGKKTIVFCAGVEHARQMADDIRQLGVSAAAIDGKTRNRTSLLKAFQNGEIEVITNYGVLTEGFDDPSVECILMARPTTSPLVYNQCIGRGLRTAPRKNHCVVIDIVDRNTHQLQYGATELAGLPKNWRSRGRDPFRECRAVQQIRVTCPEAFMQIQQAQSLEEVQSVLMALPPNVIEAGLDGEPVLRYEPLQTVPSDQDAEIACRQLLKQARARVRDIAVDDNTVLVSFHAAESNNERYEYLLWHLERVSQRAVSFKKPYRRRKNPKALLRSMVSDGTRLKNFQFQERDNAVSVEITGLSGNDMAQITEDFEAESGIRLNISGQMSIFDEAFA